MRTVQVDLRRYRELKAGFGKTTRNSVRIRGLQLNLLRNRKRRMIRGQILRERREKLKAGYFAYRYGGIKIIGNLPN